MITFAGRNFRVTKKTRDEKNAKLLTKTLANDGFWDKLRGKNFAKRKKSSFSREKNFREWQDPRTFF